MYRLDLSSPAALVGFAEEGSCVKNCQLMGWGAECFVSLGHWGELSRRVSSSCFGGEKCGSPPRCNNVWNIISEHFCGTDVAGSDDVGSFSAIVPFVCGFSASFRVLLICEPLTSALCITWQGMPVLGKLTQKSYSHLLPKHMHTDIKLPRAMTGFNLLPGSGVCHSNGLRVHSALRDTTHISEWKNTPVQPAHTLTPWTQYLSQLCALRQLTSSMIFFTHGQHHSRPWCQNGGIWPPQPDTNAISSEHFFQSHYIIIYFPAWA